MRITDNENATLEIVREFIQKSERSPKIREVAERRAKRGLGASVSAAVAALRSLRMKGKLTWKNSCHETITLTE
jgi:hypothetical protein